MAEEKQTLFLGPIVFHKERISDKPVVFLVDGQQRLTTISLFLAAFRKKIRGIDTQEAGITLLQINKHLFKVDAKTKRQQDPEVPVRLGLSKKDRQQYMAYVSTGELTGYQTYLKTAFRTVEQLIDDAVHEELQHAYEKGLQKNDEFLVEESRMEAIVELASDFEYLLSSIASFSTISVEEPFDPLTVFESLNSKGMPLAQSDLVKNLLIQHVPTKMQEGIASQWDGLADRLEGKLIDFLRYWYIAEHGFIRKKELYESIKKLILQPKDIPRLLEEWRVASEWFLALIGRAAPPNHDSKLEHQAKIFSALSFRQASPILLSIALKGKTTDLVPAINLLSSAYVRLFVTASIRGSVFENRLDSICENIRSGEKSMLVLNDEISKLVRQHCPELNWKHLRIEDRAIQKYILIELNRQLSKSRTWAPPPSGTLEVEHIIPQTRRIGDYADVNDIDYEFYVNHIGNLTLILEEDNPRCSNRSFSEKKEVYSEYDGREIQITLDGSPDMVTKDLALTRQLSKYGAWGLDEIEERAEALSALAEKRWPQPGV